MSKIKVRDLRDDLSFGSIIEGVNFETLKDPAVRAEINDVFEHRGMIVFKDVEPSAQMHVAISKVFGPLKDHPTKTTARVDKPTEFGAGRDRHASQAARRATARRRPGRDRRQEARPLVALAFRPLLQ